MKRFNLLNNIVGWVVCAIACCVYLLTIEPTASFWDCGEFIATAYKMEIGHPPGAPFFMMLGRVCTMLASDPAHVAMMVNSLSAIASGFCILFLFWTITHLTRNMVLGRNLPADAEVSLGNTIAILGAGVVGALAYTFSDTFWFSAVEGEVYASSSLFTAVVYWCMLKWEDVADEPYANRWIVLIAYLMGLSIGVHLLNLLTIPVLVLVYYYRKWENPTTKGALVALAISCVLLACVLFGMIPGFAEVAGWFELFFVNVLGLPFNTGTLIYATLLVGLLVYGIWLTFSQGNVDGPEKKKIVAVFTFSIVLLGIPFFGKGTFSHILLAVVIVAAMVWFLMQYGSRISRATLNTVLICCTMILLGYSTYAALVIRSVSNPPMDENSPDDVFALKSYLNREQYGDTPLLYGESYAAEYLRVKTKDGNAWEVSTKVGEPRYAKAIKQSPDEDDRYVHYADEEKYEYCPEFLMPFPRMYSRQASHISAYKSWANIKGKTIRYTNMGQTSTAEVPTFFENIAFFFKYQVGFMYWRYFMWNFVGRQNDIQGNGEIMHGNWCSGIPFIDKLATGGNHDLLPSDLKNNKGNNTYYFLPLLLGLCGILFQFGKEKKGMQNFWQVFILFLLTGLAIVVYLNQTPYQPRERDYAYAGSFYAFCIWIGMGVLFIKELMDKVLKDDRATAAAASVLCLGVPVLMAQQNWDDHDRSNRYTARDFGGDYLLSLAPNSVIFTNGDNDTFPLWYNQEVEGDDTTDSLKHSYQDKRVANLSYLQMGWYVSQMKRDAYDSKALPISMEEKDFSLGKLDAAYIMPNDMFPAMSVKDALRLLTSDTMQAMLRRNILHVSDDDMSFLPTRMLYLEVDSADAVNGGAPVEAVTAELNTFRQGVYDAFVKAHPDDEAGKAKMRAELARTSTYHINIDLKDKRYLGKHEIFILDLLQNNRWQRPVYFAVTVGSDSQMGLNQYFQLEGMAYRVMPYHCWGRSDTDIMYHNMMDKFKFGNANDPDVYLEENNLRMCSTMRMMFSRLASDLLAEGKRDSALKVVDRALQELPVTTVPYDYSTQVLADCYYKLGQTEKGDALLRGQMEYSRQYLQWISALDSNSQLVTAMSEFSSKAMDICDVDPDDPNMGGGGTSIFKIAKNNGRSQIADEAAAIIKEYTPFLHKIYSMQTAANS